MRSGVEEEMVLMYIRGIRVRLPRLGTRKLYMLLKPIMEKNGIKMGRDKLFAVLRDNGLLVKPRRKRKKTTDSNHGLRKYSNIIKEYEPSGPEQIWASDITFVSTEEGFVYASLITDQYSKKIVGYHVHPTLEAKGPLKALRMAMKKRCHHDTPLIHHSDRGIQYCCEEYIQLLRRSKMSISMSSPGNPYENAVAERVNGILKNEFYLDGYFLNINQVRQVLKESVSVYNNERPHASCDYLTPQQAHLRHGVLKKRWRMYNTKSRPRKIDDQTRIALEKLISRKTEFSTFQHVSTKKKKQKEITTTNTVNIF